MSIWHSLFKTTGWGLIPPGYSKDLHARLGNIRFQSFTQVCQRRNIFPAMSNVLLPYDRDTGPQILACFLTSVCNELQRQSTAQQDLSLARDAMDIAKVALELNSNHFPARISLVGLHLILGDVQEAKKEARQGLQGLDAMLSSGLHPDLPDKFRPNEKEIKNMREGLLSVIQSDKDILTSIQPSDVINIKIIERLDEILKQLFIRLIDIYRGEFPCEPKETIAHKAGTVLKELVLGDLGDEQIEFKANNAGFVDEQKLRLLKMEKIRKGIISFLIAKGALYRSWEHEDADIWLNRVRELEQSAQIPATLPEILEVIEDCLSYYKSGQTDRRDKSGTTLSQSKETYEDQHDLSTSDCNRATEINSEDVRVYKNQGRAYYDKGQYDKAISNFSTAKMVDENFKDQFVTVPKLARLLAKDSSFVHNIGLNEFQSHEIVQRLELILGFVLAMYNTAKTIFGSPKGLTLDEKFVQLIYSRVVLMPEVVLNQQDVLEYASKCYEEVKGDTKQLQHTWDNMTLYEKFFAVCVRVFIEELKLDRPDFHLAFPDFENLVSRSLLAYAFKGVFSCVNWELDKA